MSKIFISYGRENRDEVASLAEELGQLGHSVWFDDLLAGGSTWWDEILARIRESDVIIVALTPETVTSKAARRQWNYGAELGKPILPVLLTDGVVFSFLPASLSSIQYVDYRTADRKAAIALIRAVNGLSPATPLPDRLPDPPEVPTSSLGAIEEQIDSLMPLEFEQQSALVQRLELHVQNKEDLGDIRTLLNRLRRRHDLLASIDQRIDSLLAEIADTEGSELRTPESARRRRKPAAPQPATSVTPEPVKRQPEATAEEGDLAKPSGSRAKGAQLTERIFLSYRREDSADVVGRMYDRLAGKFGADAIFKDVDSLLPGLDFREQLQRRVGSCRVLLAIIGDQWADYSRAAGARALDDPADYVRIEIKAALERGIPVIPVLVKEASMPPADTLPEALQELRYRHERQVRRDPEFHHDMDRLIDGLEKLLGLIDTSLEGPLSG